MPDRTQDIKNLRAVATACKNYTDKRIDNLKWELGTYDLGVDTINGTTKLLPSPSGTIQATMVRVDGKSEVSENLLIVNDMAETTIKDVKIKVEDGNIILNGTASASWSTRISCSLLNDYVGDIAWCNFNTQTIATGNLTMQFHDANNSNVFTANIQAANQSGTTTTTNVITQIYIAWSNGTTFNNVVIKPMLVKGTTAPTEWKQGFEGIHNLELSGLKVDGANKCNILDKAQTTISGVSCQASNNKIKIQGTATASGSVDFPLSVLSSNTYSCSINIISGSQQSSTSPSIYIRNENNSYIDFFSPSRTSFSFTNSVGFIRVAWESGTTINIKFNFMLNLGSTVLDYVPYVAPTTLPIDLTSIEDSGGNKLFADGSIKGAGTAKDYITPYVAHKQISKIVLNKTDYSWQLNGNGTIRYVNNFANIIKKVALSTDTPSIISDKLNTVIWQDMYDGNITSGVSISISGNIGISISDYETLTTLEVIFELATPIEADINLSQLVKFEAYSNGSITLVNTNNQDTTSTFKYLKEVAK